MFIFEENNKFILLKGFLYETIGGQLSRLSHNYWCVFNHWSSDFGLGQSRMFGMHRYLTHILLSFSLSVSIGIQYNHDNNSAYDIEKNKACRAASATGV